MAQTPEGALKSAAQKAGVALSVYIAKTERGLKWCVLCQDWHLRSAFGSDSSRYDGLASSCKDSRQKRGRALYIPVPSENRKPSGPPPLPARNGDKKQARHRINVEIRTKKRPRPSSLPCFDCGHIWKPGERRHEYDHYLGYTAEHHQDVQAVCTTCHGRRSAARGEYKRV